MEGSSLRHGQAILVLLVILQFTTYIVLSSADAPFHNQRNIEYIKFSCSSTTYPRLCYRSLSIYASKINTSPRLLVHTGLNVTLKASKSTSRLMVNISRIHGLRPRVAAAILDCIDTWVSAALTDEDTCMDGFAGKSMKGYAKTGKEKDS
ncbi:Plant invertase/pectin methylesterase inhibitor superfamily protein [Hibiscus syriacus]|uniref:Plant invertase/pectin methylesterase inhibitor superfamily protein n=1 Tax=Hibiscus syriacus TaxID=106335 RepID=A0A6A3CG90_HIBSY|nr:Plant invertase/pectin methylesterase inhibitor superfamily protein [Hibiscus syriacus]